MMDKEDSWVWKDKELVVFMVKSAYKILKEEVQGVERELYGGFLEVEGTTIFTFHSMEGFERQNSV